jgi:hypothetical protein
MAASDTIESVLTYIEEDRDRGQLVKRHITVRDAIEQLVPSSAAATPPPKALIVTNGGLATDTPLAIVVRDDLPLLMRAYS